MSAEAVVVALVVVKTDVEVAAPCVQEQMLPGQCGGLWLQLESHQASSTEATMDVQLPGGVGPGLPLSVVLAVVDVIVVVARK